MDPKDLGTSPTVAVGEIPADRPSQREDPPARLADRYELLGLLGMGGMGAVYRARDIELDEIVALKMLLPELHEDEQMLARFRAEVRLARKVTHPNVARTFDIGEHNGAKFLTMELVDGRSLAAMLADRGALPPAEAVEIACAVCAGLSAAHAAGVVHRDLKPDNVLIAKDGRVVVTDFGIAGQHLSRGTHSGVIGTPAYMAPEQLDSGAAIDARADIYALGAVLFEMLAGERAWPGDSLMALLSTRLRGAVPDLAKARPGLPEALVSIVTRCMQTNPRDRFASAADVSAKLRDAPVRADAGAPIALREPQLLAPSDKTLAVLPLRNLGPPDDAYLADGLTDDLTDTLSMIAHLRVRPRNVVARLQSRDASPDEIGRALGVQVMVDGSLQRSGNTARFSARLISTTDGFQIWARRFQAPLNDLLMLCDDAARAIAEALTSQLEGTPREAPTDARAIELYLRAKHVLRDLHTSAEPVVELFEKALALAPNDARILAGCAIARTRMLFFSEGDREKGIARAREVAERAVHLAPNLGDAWAALARFRLAVGDAPGAARVLREGVTRAPNAALLQDALGRLLLETGTDEAFVRLEVALELDPTNIMTRTELARGLALRGEWARCDALLDASDPVVPRETMRARLALWRGVPVTIENVPPDTYMRQYLDVFASKTLTDERRAFLRDRVAGRLVGGMRVLFLQRNAEIYAFAGDAASAFEAVEKAVESQLIDLFWMDRCPLLASLRSDPKWPALRAIVETRAKAILAAYDGAS